MKIEKIQTAEIENDLIAIFEPLMSIGWFDDLESRIHNELSKLFVMEDFLLLQLYLLGKKK